MNGKPSLVTIFSFCTVVVFPLIEKIEETRATANQGGTTGKSQLCIYDFETGTKGWKHQTYRDSRAIYSVIQSRKDVAKYGHYSLEALVNLICDNDSLSKGETFVDVASDTSFGAYGPKNLQGKTISCWVMAPWEAVGEWSNRNGIQIFAKDISNRSQYGEWHTIEGDGWFNVTYTPTRNPTSAQRENGMWTQTGFNLTKITMVGVKISGGGGSRARFKGKINIDCVTWKR